MPRKKPRCAPLPSSPPVAAPHRPAYAYLADSYVYQWKLASFRTDWQFVVAVVVCLAAGLAAGHPGAALIAAGGAITAGYGPKQTIDGSPLLPVLFVSFGMAVSTFLGMAAGHENWVLTLLASSFGFGYGMLSKREAGYGWVGQQCVVTLLIASAFPSSARDAAVRGSLMLAGGIVQLLVSAALLRLFSDLGRRVRQIARYVHEEHAALRQTYLQAVLSLRQRQLRDSALPYAVRLTVVLALSTEIYRALHFASGYWIPMTALLVMRPGIADTASRALARTLGTLAGAALSSIFLLYMHPSTPFLAGCAALFTWLAYSTLNVNYALFSAFLTSYIVFLLALTNLPGPEIAHRRFVCTLLGGAIALAVRLTVIRLRQKQDRASVHEMVRREEAGARS